MRRVILAVCAVLLIAVYLASAQSAQPDTAPEGIIASQTEDILAPAILIDDSAMNWSTWETISPDTIVHIVPVEANSKRAISLSDTPRNAIIAFFEEPTEGIHSEDCPITDPDKTDDPHRIS